MTEIPKSFFTGSPHDRNLPSVDFVHYLNGAAMFKQIAIAAALTVVASSSFASEYGYSSFYPSNYVGGDIGSTRLNGQSERHNSYGVYVGYEFAQNFAFEIGARRLGEFDACCHHLIIDQAAVSLIGALPLGNLSVFGRIGYNKLKITAKPPHVPTERETGSLVGVGLGFTFSPTVSARIEIQQPNNESKWRNVGVGLTIRY
jgi:OOP family OmpA-OmpF porin